MLIQIIECIQPTAGFITALDIDHDQFIVLYNFTVKREHVDYDFDTAYIDLMVTDVDGVVSTLKVRTDIPLIIIEPRESEFVFDFKDHPDVKRFEANNIRLDNNIFAQLDRTLDEANRLNDSPHLRNRADGKRRRVD